MHKSHLKLRDINVVNFNMGSLVILKMAKIECKGCYLNQVKINHFLKQLVLSLSERRLI